MAPQPLRSQLISHIEQRSGAWAPSTRVPLQVSASNFICSPAGLIGQPARLVLASDRTRRASSPADAHKWPSGPHRGNQIISAGDTHHVAGLSNQAF